MLACLFVFVSMLARADDSSSKPTAISPETFLFLGETHRIAGIDTPRLGSEAGCPEERELAERAMARLDELFKGVVVVKRTNEIVDGARLATIYADGKNVTDVLLDEKLAVRSNDVAHNWCPKPTVTEELGTTLRESSAAVELNNEIAPISSSLEEVKCSTLPEPPTHEMLGVEIGAEVQKKIALLLLCCFFFLSVLLSQRRWAIFLGEKIGPPLNPKVGKIGSFLTTIRWIFRSIKHLFGALLGLLLALCWVVIFGVLFPGYFSVLVLHNYAWFFGGDGVVVSGESCGPSIWQWVTFIWSQFAQVMQLDALGFEVGGGVVLREDSIARVFPFGFRWVIVFVGVTKIVGEIRENFGNVIRGIKIKLSRYISEKVRRFKDRFRYSSGMRH